MNIIWKGAHPNNYLKGRSGYEPDRIVLHWIVGTLASADATFNNPTRYASSTYGVGGNRIHQYVKESNAPYTNGDWLINMKSITIEHEGSPQNPPTITTETTSAKLIADICERYGWTVDYALRKPRHNQYQSTQCPGSLDIAFIKKKAKEFLMPEHEKNNKSIKKQIYVATVGVNLVSFLDGKTVKSYPKGTQFEIASETTYKGKKYLRTAYSTSKGIWSGLLASALEIPAPEQPPAPQPPATEPEPEPIDDDIVGRVTRLELIVEAMLSALRAVWSAIGGILNKIKDK